MGSSKAKIQHRTKGKIKVANQISNASVRKYSIPSYSWGINEIMLKFVVLLIYKNCSNEVHYQFLLMLGN